MRGPALALNASQYSPQDAEEYVLLTLTQNYVMYATTTLLVYELFTTFDEEVERVWSLRWRLPKVLFIINRYIARALLILQFIVGDYPGMSAEFCDVYGIWQVIPARLAILVAQALMVIRLWAIYNNSKVMLFVLLSLYTVEFTAVVACSVLVSINTQGASQPSPLGCGLEARSPLLKNYASGTWIAPVCFEFVILILTLVKIAPPPGLSSLPFFSRVFQGASFTPRQSRNPTLDLLARDSLIYFAFVFTFTLTNALLYELSFGSFYRAILLGPTSAISCIAVSRMIINIRSLPNPLSEDTASDPNRLDVPSMHMLSTTGVLFADGRVIEADNSERYLHSKRQSTSVNRMSGDRAYLERRSGQERESD
ncbi:hypothetical protein MIND_00775500 [Mycena indigotica]|uniref:DUF6533 domain-containing protein n=1 Tax=Mycena indigotica TaxID=2126181 RepID=A0A8H6W531_9AGAR|nr:uncharacterized protein MIND_00775500 [Mycena indigotica]KAF7302088.1 hypothetical protein MIND_00775500 [Mycena indigotica]